jgi:hypothetical protein
MFQEGLPEKTHSTPSQLHPSDVILSEVRRQPNWSKDPMRYQ